MVDPKPETLELEEQSRTLSARRGAVSKADAKLGNVHWWEGLVDCGGLRGSRPKP